MKQLYPLIGLLLTDTALADVDLFEQKACSRSSYFLNKPNFTETFPNLHQRIYCRTFQTDRLALSSYFEDTGFEKQLNLETTFRFQRFDTSFFIDYQNPDPTLNTGFLLRKKITPNLEFNIGLIEPLDSFNPQFVIGLEFQF